jgi:hypothetical protein
MAYVTTLQSVELGVLGPVQVGQNGAPVIIPGTKPRAILPMLGLHSRSVVSADALVKLLRGAEPARTAAKTTQTHISRPEQVFELRLETADEGSQTPMVRRGLPAVVTGPGPIVGRGRELERLLSACQTALAGGAAGGPQTWMRHATQRPGEWHDS